jgi:hypothetical protein
MSRRSTPQHQIDERAWPVRILIRVPDEGLGGQLDAMYAWLDSSVGRGSHACHAGPRFGLQDSVALYFRHPRIGVESLEAFPVLGLADGTERE